MPIRQILPDGKVRIYNKKTGEEKDIAPEELGKYSPSMIGAYQKMIDQQALAKQGVLDVGELAKTDPTSAINITKQNGFTAPPSKEDQARSGVLGVIDTLKESYNQPTAAGVRPNPGRTDDLSAAAEPGVGGRIQGFMMGAAASLNMAPDAKTYRRMKEGFVASLKEATGDTGVLTDADAARIVAAMPEFGDTDETALKAWEAVDSILMSKYGKTGKYNYLDKTPAPEGQAPMKKEESLDLPKIGSDLLFSGTKKYAQESLKDVQNLDLPKIGGKALDVLAQDPTMGVPAAATLRQLPQIKPQTSVSSPMIEAGSLYGGVGLGKAGLSKLPSIGSKVAPVVGKGLGNAAIAAGVTAPFSYAMYKLLGQKQ